MTRLPISNINRDGGTQLRAAGSEATVAEYTEALISGATFPPIVVFHDGADYWLADGFHRYEAHVKAGMTEISVDVRDGSRRDAVLFAAGANADHGLRRTQADKRQAVETLLRDPEWRNWSDSDIGRRARVDHKTVGKIRRELTGIIDGEIPVEGRKFITKHGTEATRTVMPSQTKPGSVFAKVLNKVLDDDLRAECERRGWSVEVSHA